MCKYRGRIIAVAQLRVQPQLCEFLSHFHQKFSCNCKLIALVRIAEICQLCVEMQPQLSALLYNLIKYEKVR